MICRILVHLLNALELNQQRHDVTSQFETLETHWLQPGSLQPGPWGARSIIMGTHTGQLKRQKLHLIKWAICLCILPVFQTKGAAAATSEWVISQDRDGFTMMANRQDINLRISLNADPARTKLISSERHPIHKHIEVIRYNASGDDAHQLVIAERAVLFNTRSRKLLGDFPLRYVARRAPSDQQPRQPKWQVDYRSIKIFDPDTRQTTLLPMK